MLRLGELSGLQLQLSRVVLDPLLVVDRLRQPAVDVAHHRIARRLHTGQQSRAALACPDTTVGGSVYTVLVAAAAR